jgi:uncharacterized membrane protein
VKGEISDEDRLMAALVWVFFPFALMVLGLEERRSRPFQKYHAVHALAFSLVFFILISIIVAMIGEIGLILAVCWLIVFYWAYRAYHEVWVEIPYLTDFIKDQGWI